ncbi:cysteine desulfurase-like protein [Rhodococcus aerolatus]
MSFDVARVRGLFPALGDGWVHLDAQAGMQVPETVATTVSTAMRAPVSGPGGAFPSSQRGEAVVEAARGAVADLVGGHPRGVVLGADRAQLLARLAESVSGHLVEGTQVVVSRLDAAANVAPWLRVAERGGAEVRWAEVDIETCELPEWQYGELLADAPALVAVTAASGTVGTRPVVPAIVEQARAAGAFTVVDAGSAAPFLPLDIHAMGADVVAVSGSAWGGPPSGALVFREPDVLEELASLSLDPDARGPERLELGQQPFALLAGLFASVEYLAGLDDAAVGTRRQRLLTSMGSAKAYEAGLLSHLLGSLRAMPQVMVIGDPMRRIPVISFSVAGVSAKDVVHRLADNGICAFSGDRGTPVLDALGVDEVGGAVQVGLAHYTTAGEVDQLVRAVASLG